MFFEILRNRSRETIATYRGRSITMEYVLLAGWNDSTGDARLLARLVTGLQAKVNAIPSMACFFHRVTCEV